MGSISVKVRVGGAEVWLGTNAGGGRTHESCTARAWLETEVGVGGRRGEGLSTPPPGCGCGCLGGVRSVLEPPLLPPPPVLPAS